MKYKFSLIIHAGAGYHSLVKEDLYNLLCSTACQQVLQYTKATPAENFCPRMAVTIALQVLEDSELTNAGYGSNLTDSAQVELEAGLMDGYKLRFAALGGLKTIRNPSTAVMLFLNEQINVPVSNLGRVFPTFLFGSGAEAWITSETDIKTVKNTNLISRSAKKLWYKYTRLINKKPNSVDSSFKRARLDTIGAVCIGPDGRIAAGVSSGGIAIKRDGRVGHSCIFGCGCWADEYIGVATSGTGEQIIRAQFAQKLSEHICFSNNEDSILTQTLEDAFDKHFLNSRFLKDDPSEKLVGCIGINHDKSSCILEIFYGHTTKSMSIGYITHQNTRNPCAFISRRPENKQLSIGSIAIKF